MRENINTNQPIYFYDNNNNANFILKLTDILYQDETVCLCKVETDDGEQFDDKILFKLKEHTIENAEFYYWVGTNDIECAQTHLKEQKIRQKIVY